MQNIPNLLKRTTAVKKAIRYGDITIIAEMSGYSKAYVRQVLNPDNTRTNSTILEAAEKYIAFRQEQMVQRFESFMSTPNGIHKSA